jgi:hypothetical protein
VYSVEFDDQQFTPASDGELFISVTDNDLTDGVAQGSVIGPDSAVPADPKLKVGSVDVSADTVTEVNRQPELRAETVLSGQINVSDVATDQLTADNSGSVSFASPTDGIVEGCRVSLSGDQTISTASNIKINFDQVTYDNGGNFDATASEWVCPADGIYMVTVQGSFVAGGSDEVRSVKIGTATNSGPFGQGASSVQISDPKVRLQSVTVNRYSAGDTIAFYAQNQAGSDTLAAGNGQNFDTFAEVALLGGL